MPAGSGPVRWISSSTMQRHPRANVGRTRHEQRAGPLGEWAGMLMGRPRRLRLTTVRGTAITVLCAANRPPAR
jgi:hypothetical protein